ncbi:hypothetical protein QJT78_52550, partial [Bradyrhizobium sp. Mp27]|nr:hypothetical protein [Bradyrhizobium sp. Mp27]
GPHNSLPQRLGKGARHCADPRQPIPGRHLGRLALRSLGGRGETPTAWPAHPGGDRLVGYAGGISPENIHGVMSVLEQTTGRYWIDM